MGQHTRAQKRVDRARERMELAEVRLNLGREVLEAKVRLVARLEDEVRDARAELSEARAGVEHVRIA